MTTSGWLDPERSELHAHPLPDIYALSDTECYKGRRWQCTCGAVFTVDTGHDRDGEWRTWRAEGSPLLSAGPGG